MADHSPTEVARLLGVQGATLRTWAKEYAAFLSPSAAASGPKVRRRYQESDLAQLRTIQAQLRTGATHEQVRAQLASGQAAPLLHDGDTLSDAADDDDSSENHSHYEEDVRSSVVVLDERPELEALRSLLDAQARTLQAQEATLQAQAQLISQLQEDSAQLRQDAAQARQQLSEAHQHTHDVRDDLTQQLAEVRGSIERLPRWLRVLLGL